MAMTYLARYPTFPFQLTDKATLLYECPTVLYEYTSYWVQPTGTYSFEMSSVEEESITKSITDTLTATVGMSFEGFTAKVADSIRQTSSKTKTTANSTTSIQTWDFAQFPAGYLYKVVLVGTLKAVKHEYSITGSSAQTVYSTFVDQSTLIFEIVHN